MKRVFNIESCNDTFDIFKEVFGVYGLEPKQELDWFDPDNDVVEFTIEWKIGEYDYDIEAKEWHYVLNPCFKDIEVFHARKQDGIVYLSNVTDIVGGGSSLNPKPYDYIVYDDCEELDWVDPVRFPSVVFDWKESELTDWRDRMKSKDTPITIIQLSYDSELVIVG